MKSKYNTYKDEGILTKVSEEDDGFSISMESTCFFLQKKNIGDAVPKVDDTLVMHVYGGSSVRGVDLNGISLYYFTDDDIDEQHRQMKAKYKKEQEERFEKEKTQMDTDYEELPEHFQKRIDRFRKNNPNFRVEFESYELFCCKEAVKITNACKTPEKIKEFKEMGYEDQVKFANISDGHSGNTFGCACALAFHYLSNKENVEKLHGALSPLVGSKAYGDIAK